MDTISGNLLDYPIHEPPIFSHEIPEPQRPRSSSILRERISNSSNSQSSVNNNTSIQHTSTNNTNVTNTTDSLQQNRVLHCDCGFEPVLREVKKDNINRGRHFWSCSKFGGPNHSGRCNFFRWDNPINHDDDDAMAESSSSAQNRYTRSGMPYVLIESTNIVENNNDDGDDDDETSDEEEEVNLTPNHDQLSENGDTRASTITTPPTTPHRRTRNFIRRTSSPQPISTPVRHGTDASVVDVTGNTHTRSLTGDVYTRNPSVFDNWNNVPKFSTPQLLDIIQNHLVKQDKNYKKWFTTTQSGKKELEEAKKEVEKLKRDLEVVSRENKLNKRESEVLKAEKRLLQHENDLLKEENRELKRRRF